MPEQQAETGIDLIAAERRRQIEKEGWTPEHDDGHDAGELQKAAYLYVRFGGNALYPVGFPPPGWPWAAGWWKPTSDEIRNLTKAGALIAAEIDRLKRCAGREGEQDVAPAMSFTAGYLLDRGLWSEACEVLGLNEWAVKEGQMDRSESVHMTEAQAKRIGVIANV